MIKETTLTGTPEEVRARVARMAAAGVKQIAIAGGKQVITDFATNVIRH